MLETYTKALVKKTGAQNFFPRKDLTKEANLLTLVKIKQRSRNTFLYPVTTKVEIIQKDLPSLIGEDGFSPVYDEELVVSNFKWSKGRKRAGKVAGGYHEVETEVTLSIDAVDGMKNSVDIMKKTVNIDKLEWKVRKDVLDTLGLKNDDKLAFIYQIMYSTVPWELSKKSNTEGIFKASLKKLLHISGKFSSVYQLQHLPDSWVNDVENWSELFSGLSLSLHVTPIQRYKILDAESKQLSFTDK